MRRDRGVWGYLVVVGRSGIFLRLEESRVVGRRGEAWFFLMN